MERGASRDKRCHASRESRAASRKLAHVAIHASSSRFPSSLTSTLGPRRSPGTSVHPPQEAGQGGPCSPRPRSQHPHRSTPGALFASVCLNRPGPCPDRRPVSSLQLNGSLCSVLYVPAFFAPGNKVSIPSRCDHCPQCANKTHLGQASPTQLLQVARTSESERCGDRLALWVSQCILLRSHEIMSSQTRRRRMTSHRAHPVTGKSNELAPLGYVEQRYSIKF